MAHPVRHYPSPSFFARHQALPPACRAEREPPLASIVSLPPAQQHAYLDLSNIFLAGAQVSAYYLGMASSPAQAAKLHIFDPAFRLNGRALKDIAVGPFAVQPRCVAIGSVIDPTDTRVASAMQRAGWHTQMRLRSPGCREKGVETSLSLKMQSDLLFSADRSRPNEVTLISGDSDMCPAVEELRARGIEVDVASFEHVLSDDLKKLARRVVWLDDYFGVLAWRNDRPRTTAFA